MGQLANRLMHKGFLKTDILIEAFSEMSRVEFVPERFSSFAEQNVSFPIGYGHVSPAPSVIAFMLELLSPQASQNILVVGSGMGWTTGLLSYVVGSGGKVTTLEPLDALLGQAQKNIAKYNFIARSSIVQFEKGNPTEGFAKNAPYDGILVTMEEVDTQNLTKQLAMGGTLVLPEDDVIVFMQKRENDEIYKERFNGISFSAS